MSFVITRCVSNGIKLFNPFHHPTSLQFLQHRTFYTSLKMASKRSYTLKYFNFRVLGEPIRWQFALAGVEFEDKRLPRDTWDVDYKNTTGWGRLPILQIDEDIEITQSCSISRYLAKEFNQLPESALQQAKCDELVDNLQDLRLWWRSWVREFDPIKKSGFEREMKEIHFPFYLPKIEEFVKTNGGGSGFAVGDNLTWDLYLANFMEIWTDNHGSELLDKFPLLEKHKNKILNIPQIKEWNSKRPLTKL